MPAKLGLVVLLLLKCLSALGQMKAEEKPNPAPDFSKEAYTIERIATQVTAEDDGTGSRDTTAEVKVLADAGVKAFAVLNFTYTSDNEVVEIDYVRVRKPDGTVVKTPDYNIQDMPGEVSRAAPLYSDIHEKHVAVKGLGVGDVLEYQVRYRIVKPLVARHFWEEYSFTKTAIAKDEELQVSFPAGKYVKVVSPEFKPEIKEESGRRIYRWKHANLLVEEKDPNEVPRRTPPNPDVQITTFESWEEVGRWYGDLQKTQMKVTPAIQAKADELTKGLTSDDEKIHALYNFVSLKYHYIGLDFGIGRFQPHEADDVLDNGYGDCKDKHTLLAALLKAVGIEAWPVLIHSQRKLDADVPSPAQFNHVITVVAKGENVVWLDTTPEVSPYGLLLINLRDKQALVIPTDKPANLETTPANPPFPEEQEFSAEGKLSADGTFTGHMKYSSHGDSEVLLRTLFRQVSESQWKEAVQRLSYGMNFGGEVSNVAVTPPDQLDKPFELSYDYVRKSFGDWENHQITAPLPPIGMEIVKGAPEKKPSEPVLLGGLGKATFHSKIQLPAGYLAIAPSRSHMDESFAEYTGDTQIKDGVLITSRKMVVKKNEVPLSDWDAFSKFGHAVADDEFAYIRLSAFSAPSGPKMTADEKEEQLRKLFKENPQEPETGGMLGEFLMVRGKYSDAATALEAAVKAVPDNAGLDFELGQAYLKTGDKNKALSRMRDAIELKDDDPIMLNNVSFILSDNNVDLGLAVEYGEKALDELDDEAKGGQSSDEAGLRVTYLYSLVWDTLGWGYFRQGQTKKAEALIRAAWYLGEDGLVAEHLGEVYEKEGKTEEAARAYQEALAVSPMPMPTALISAPPEDVNGEYQKQQSEIKTRYRKLTGKDPSLYEIRRLPNGQWTQTPAERLRHTREIKVSNEHKLSGSA